MKRKRRWWSKKAEKEHERLEREIAEDKAKARSQSQNRQEDIKIRWDLDEQQFKAAKKPTDRKNIEQKLKKQKLNKLLNSIRKLADDEKIIDRIRELFQSEESKELADELQNVFDRIEEVVELAGLQDREIEYLTQFLRDWELIQAHYPKELENLYSASLMALMRQASLYLPKRKRDPQREWERKHGDYKWCGGVGLIEYEFGGAGAGKWYEMTHGLSATGEPYQPTCLDEIFAGGAVHMHNSEREAVFLGQPKPHRILQPGLQLLFGMHSNGFPKNLTSFTNRRNRRERLYDYRAVTEIMEALLKPREGKTSVRGRPRRLWPTDPDLRTPVLSRIEARINSLSVPEQIKPHIKAKFLAVAHRPPPDSAKK